MKKLAIMVVAAATFAFAASNAMADLRLNVSGTARYQNTSTYYVGTVTTKTFNEKTVYTLISNAVANVNDLAALAPKHIPANGYIAFKPSSNDGGPEYGNGFFYVTNSSGYYLPLSGYDTNDEYYSFIELDSVAFYGEDSTLYLGFEGYYYYPFFGNSASYSINTHTGNGSSTTRATAVLYIHDDPYYYNDAENPDNLASSSNENAIEIRGILTGSLTLKDFSISNGSISLSGSGNFLMDDYDFWGVDTGSASLTH